MSESSPATLQWRPMMMADLPEIDDLSARIHPDFPERPEILAEKFSLFPGGCFVIGEAEARIQGYCFSHCWTFGPPPALDTRLGALPQQPSAYFIHDLTIEASLRRRNLASLLVTRLIEIARSIPVDRMMLVAVSGSEPFWTRMGFRRTADQMLQAAAREKYGRHAVQMDREVW
ncbi:GNAT family N-acetyltransferase [Pseudorhodoplanes sp.]|uniref:GNAT family N-acetyltransferase n=1 Tax=Pseudorhodoplanes sp. TaxID=1934341 RepID=UPI003D14587B